MPENPPRQPTVAHYLTGTRVRLVNHGAKPSDLAGIGTKAPLTFKRISSTFEVSAGWEKEQY
jgi:hypothetical protein